MTCNEIEKWLDEYVDGELPEEARGAVEEHLRTCLACHRALTELRALLERARGLPAEIEPEETLWPGIEARIAAPPAVAEVVRGARPEPSRWLLRWHPLAAAAVLLLAVAIPFTLWQLGRGAVQGPPIAQSNRPGTERERTAELATAELARSEDGVLLPWTDLLETLERQRGNLPRETVATIEENARLIDQAIAQIRTALDNSPADRQLQHLLAARYQQEVALLKRVSQV